MARIVHASDGLKFDFIGLEAICSTVRYSKMIWHAAQCERRNLPDLHIIGGIKARNERMIGRNAISRIVVEKNPQATLASLDKVACSASNFGSPKDVRVETASYKIDLSVRTLKEGRQNVAGMIRRAIIKQLVASCLGGRPQLIQILTHRTIPRSRILHDFD